MSLATVTADDVDALFESATDGTYVSEPAVAPAREERATPPCAPQGSVLAPEAAPPVGEQDGDDANARLFLRIGQVTRMLHEALSELGYDRKLASAASTMPDARKRLEYVASLTGRSAAVVLEGVEQAQVLQQAVESGAAGLETRWKALAAPAAASAEWQSLALDTREYLAFAQRTGAATREHLLAMMMAQDFHDLTGQVIQKIVAIAHNVEGSLVDLLLETRAPEEAPTGTLAGPAIGNEPPGETVASQEQVDQLLNSLGF